VEFQWDQAKRETILKERGVDILYAALIFEGDVLTAEDDRYDYGEVRFISVGMVEDECFVVVHTERDGVIRLITAWKGGAMREPNIRRASLAELKEMKEKGKLAHNPDAPEGENPGADFWTRAELRGPNRPRTRSVHLKLDPDVFEFFYEESGGKGHLTKMQNVLRTYVSAHRQQR
jgi:uncharacterized DUF497 family protein